MANVGFVRNPLSYTLDDNDFYRIEGHLGQPYKIALQTIKGLKAQYALPFDVISLVLQKGSSSTPTKVTEELLRTESEDSEASVVSISDLRSRLLEVSNAYSDVASTEDTSVSEEVFTEIAEIDHLLGLLNDADFATPTDESPVTVITEDEKDEIKSELFSDFLERHAGLEHLAGVQPGGTFVLVHESERNNTVIADFSLPYLCCSKVKPNDPPVAVNDSVSTEAGGVITIPVLGNDYDPDNDSLTVIIKSYPF